MPDHQQASGQSTVPIVTIANGRAIVRLNRPREHNRLEPIDLAALQETSLRSMRTGRSACWYSPGPARASARGSTSARSPTASPGTDNQSEDRDAFERTVDRLEALRVPTIAALNGSVYGGATDLALACDFRIGVAGMGLLMPAARLGIVYYESGIRRYVTRLGVAAAKKLFMTAEPIDDSEMLRIGYLDEVVTPATLMDRADALAARLAANAPLAVAGLKRAINETAAGALDHDALATVRALCSASADHAEAVRAWTEKRAPVFSGR